MVDLGEYVFLYLTAFTLSVFMVPAVRRLAIRLGAVDLPDGIRKIHTTAVPRMGGVAIFIAFIVPIVAMYVIGYYRLPNRVPGLFTELEGQVIPAAALLGASLLMLLLGVYDDIRHASPKVKLFVQAVAAVIICVAGIRISGTRNPFTGNMMEFGWFAYPLTIFWILAVTNAINLIDGMDGLGPGVGLFVAGTMFAVSLVYGVTLVSLITSVLVGAIIGFLIFNFHPAKIFMGDSGSLFIGFVLAAMAVQNSVKRALLVPVIALALPIVDTLMAIVRRWSKGLPMSAPDKQHVHHRLIQMGFSQRQAVFVLYGICAVLGCAALAVALLRNPVAVVSAYAVIIGAISVAAYVLGGRELWTLATRVRRGWNRRRAQDEAWTQVYVTTARLERAETLDDVWKELETLFDRLDLDAARADVNPRGAAPRRFEWTRPGTSSERTADGSLREGWTLRVSLGNHPPVRGELVLGKDARRGPLAYVLGEMSEVLRAELVKAVARLTMLSVPEAPGPAADSGAPAVVGK